MVGDRNLVDGVSCGVMNQGSHPPLCERNINAAAPRIREPESKEVGRDPILAEAENTRLGLRTNSMASNGDVECLSFWWCRQPLEWWAPRGRRPGKRAWVMNDGGQIVEGRSLTVAEEVGEIVSSVGCHVVNSRSRYGHECSIYANSSANHSGQCNLNKT